jgi:hypothetical protein
MERARAWAGSIGLVTPAAVVIAIAFTAWAYRAYGGDLVWPGLIGNFAASLGAFLLALRWDRHAREAEEQSRLEEVEKAAQTELNRKQDRSRTEARRRLGIIERELEMIAKGVAEAKKVHDVTNVVLPDLPTGGWQAGAEALGRLLADYDLVSRLGSLCDRVRDLEWRLRVIAETNAMKFGQREKLFVNHTFSLAGDLERDLQELQPRVSEQAAEPDVRPVGLIQRLSATVGVFPELRVTGGSPAE